MKRSLRESVNLGNVIGNLFIAWWFIWYLGRCHAFALGTVILLVGVALQAGATVFASKEHKLFDF